MKHNWSQKGYKCVFWGSQWEKFAVGKALVASQ